jgi:hypothetical protein
MENRGSLFSCDTVGDVSLVGQTSTCAGVPVAATKKQGDTSVTFGSLNQSFLLARSYTASGVTDSCIQSEFGACGISTYLHGTMEG